MKPATQVRLYNIRNHINELVDYLNPEFAELNTSPAPGPATKDERYLFRVIQSLSSLKTHIESYDKYTDEPNTRRSIIAQDFRGLLSRHGISLDKAGDFNSPPDHSGEASPAPLCPRDCGGIRGNCGCDQEARNIQ